MIRFFFRLLATVALAIAVIMAVLDATRSVAGQELVLTPLRTSWSGVSPDTLAAFEQLVRANIHPLAWDPAALWLLHLPGFAVFAMLAFLLYAIGRRPTRSIGRFAVEN